jgi:hypothetical protein
MYLKGEGGLLASTSKVYLCEAGPAREAKSKAERNKPGSCWMRRKIPVHSLMQIDIAECSRSGKYCAALTREGKTVVTIPFEQHLAGSGWLAGSFLEVM